MQLVCPYMKSVFNSEAVRSAVWCCSSRKCKKFVTEAKKSNVVHFLIVLWFIYTRCEVHSIFSSLKKLRFNKRNHAVLFPVWCSVVFCPMQCGFQSDEVPTSIWVSRKTKCACFDTFKTALKPWRLKMKLASILDVFHSLSPCGPLAWSTRVKN